MARPPAYDICMKYLLLPAASAVLWAQNAPPPYVQEGKTAKVSEHVWVIPDGRVNLVPNIGFIVGSNATLVVDSGMGDRNGQAVLRELRKVSGTPDLYLTTTHFHPEHVTGFHVFPAGAKLIRPALQQQELSAKGPGMIANFSSMSPAHAELLKGAVQRPADIVFDSSVEINLGGVTARLFTLGPAHTKGDNFIWVREDNLLFGGDILTNRFFPILPDADSNGKHWIAILDRLAALRPRTIVPGHGEVDTLGIIAREREILQALQSRTRKLKSEGASAEDAAKILSQEFRARYPRYEGPGLLPNGVRKFYAEAP
jgi:glyoxylase-like metal-dependent hydrolase (beta-lactamase superfamily II)